MCANLMRAGFSASVYNRSRPKAEGLLSQGARWADSPRAVAAESDAIFSIVGYPADVREVLLGVRQHYLVVGPAHSWSI